MNLEFLKSYFGEDYTLEERINQSEFLQSEAMFSLLSSLAHTILENPRLCKNSAAMVLWPEHCVDA